MEQGLHAFSYHEKSWAPQSNYITGFNFFWLWSVEPHSFNAFCAVVFGNVSASGNSTSSPRQPTSSRP